MKRINLSIIIFFILAGCTDNFLGRKPKARLTTETLTSLKAAEEAVNGIYGPLLGNDNDQLFSNNLEKIAALPSPYLETRTGGGTYRINIHTLTPSNGIIASVWSNAYKVINRANTAIKALEDIHKNVEEPKGYNKVDRLKGEAQFLRALMYYYLIKAFGNVPVPFKSLTPQESKNVPQLAPEKAWNKVAQSLKEAAQTLPLKSEWPPKDLGRPTRGAAQTLLAKVQLNAGNYKAAMETANKVIQSGEYSLYSNQFGDWSNYYDIFRDSQENGPGSVFEIQQSVASDHIMTSQRNIHNSPSDYTVLTNKNVQAIKGIDTLAWGDYIDPDNFPASAKTIGGFRQGFGSYYPSTYLKNQFDSKDPRKYITIMGNGAFYPGFGIVWAESAPQWTGKYMGTLKEKKHNILFGWWWGGNIPVLRYAGVLLTYSEAAALSKINLSGAVEKINMVRARASSSNYTLPPRPRGNFSQSKVLKWVRKERLLEFAMEGNTFFDLQRYAKHHPDWHWSDVMSHSQGVKNWQKKYELFPIPLQQVNLGNYKQNPGY